MSGSKRSLGLFGKRWVTSGSIPFDHWHRETLIGVTLCGAVLNLGDMLSSLGDPVRKCPTCVILMDRPDEDEELIPA